jgi:hypothetical protein
MKRTLLLSLPILLPSLTALGADFQRDIVPILKAECYKCHSEEAKKEKGGFVFDNVKRFSKDIGPGRVIEPGKPEKSDFISSFTLDLDDDDHMPPKKNLTPAQIAKFKEWVAEGASFDGGKSTVAATTPAPPTLPGSVPATATTSVTPSSPAAAAVMQNWTNTEGKVIQAEMLKLEGANVVLRMANGQVYNYPLSKLSAESQMLAKGAGK